MTAYRIGGQDHTRTGYGKALAKPPTPHGRGLEPRQTCCGGTCDRRIIEAMTLPRQRPQGPATRPPPVREGLPKKEARDKGPEKVPDGRESRDPGDSGDPWSKVPFRVTVD